MKASPFNLSNSDKVNATVISINLLGDSDVSNVGNGAIIVTTPEAPTNLVKDHSLTTTNQVSFAWSAPEDDSGSSILGYSV